MTTKMTRTFILNSGARLLLGLLVMSALVSPLLGADQYWTGTSSPFWTDPGNWSSGVAPVSGDNLFFTLGNFSNSSNYNDFPSDTIFSSITIGEGNFGANYILAGARIIVTNVTEYGARLSGYPQIDCDITFSYSYLLISVGHSLSFNGTVAILGDHSLATAGSGALGFNGTVTAGTTGGVINKTNSGQLELSSGAVCQARVSVTAGIFRMNGAVSTVRGNNSVTCRGGTVQGTGIADLIQIEGAGTLIPGDFGPGVMQVNSAADFSFGTLVEQINGTIPGTGYSQLIGTCNLGPCPAQPSLYLALGYAPQLGDSFQIIQGPVSGTFAGLSPEGVAETNGYAFAIFYTNGVTLTTIRTPNSPFLLWSGNGSCSPYPTGWSCTNNWVPSMAPGSGSRLLFSHFQNRVQSSCQFIDPSPQTNDLPVGTSLASLLYTDTNYVLYGNPITVTEGITNQITQGTNSCFLDLVAAGPLVFDGEAGGTFVMGGSFNGSGTVQKEGGGRLLYTGTTMNAFVGSVVVDSGEFRADGSFTDGSFTVNGGLLTGTGTVSTLTMNGGTLLPGANPGILHIQGDLTVNTGAVLQVELNGPTPGNGYDQLEVNGTVNLNGGTLSVLPGFSIAPGTSFLVLVNDTSNPIAGSFAGLSEGATFQAGGQYFSISYQAGPHINDVLLTRLSPPGNLSAITELNPGTVQLQGTGGSNVAYTILANTNLTTTNWQNIGAVTSGASGTFLFSVTNVLAFPQRFFRVQTP